MLFLIIKISGLYVSGEWNFLSYLGGSGGGDGDLFWPGTCWPPGPPDTDRDWQCFNITAVSRGMSRWPHHCHVTAGSMQQMLLLARHKSYWDARYVRCKALRRTLQCATPGAEDEQRAAGDRISFLAGSGAPGVPGQRYCHDVTKTRGHVSRVTLTMSILTIRSNTPEWW